jgi:hypothetical protein
MTTQSLDHILYRGEDYAILSEGSGTLFHPWQVTIIPEEMHTACYRGYQSTYEITDHALFLDTLVVRAKDGRYPFINDTPPSFPAGVPWWQISHATYKNLGLSIPYTGTMRLGKYPDHDYEIMMFGCPDWAYRRVLDAVFVEGRLRSVADLSEAMAEIRAEQPKTAMSNEDLAKMIAKCRVPVPKHHTIQRRATAAKKRKRQPRTA